MPTRFKILCLLLTSPVAVACMPGNDGPTEAPTGPPPSLIYGDGTNCEAATWDSYQWCYVFFNFRNYVSPPDPCGFQCVTTHPLLWSQRQRVLNTIARLSGHSNSDCATAGLRLQQLLNSDRISRRVLEDWNARGETIWATTWISSWPFQSQAVHIWQDLFDRSSQFIDFTLVHEMYHDMWASYDESGANLFATTCVGAP